MLLLATVYLVSPASSLETANRNVVNVTCSVEMGTCSKFHDVAPNASHIRAKVNEA